VVCSVLPDDTVKYRTQTVAVLLPSTLVFYLFPVRNCINKTG